MKTFQSYLPSALLLAYAIYSAFIQVSIAHSIILFSLAALFAYNQFLTSVQNPSLLQEVAKFKRELEEQMKQHKEFHDSQLSAIEGEITKIAMSSIKSPSSAPQKQEAKTKYIF